MIGMGIGVDWANLSVGVAAVVAMVYVVRTLRKMQADVLTFFGNHMTQMVKSLTDVAASLSSQNSKIDQLHWDNVVSQSHAKQVAEQLTRSGIPVIAKEPIPVVPINGDPVESPSKSDSRKAGG